MVRALLARDTDNGSLNAKKKRPGETTGILRSKGVRFSQGKKTKDQLGGR